MLPTEVIKRTWVPFALYSPAGDVRGAPPFAEGLGEGTCPFAGGLGEGLLVGLGDTLFD